MGADKAQGGEAYRRNEGGWILFLLYGSFPDFGVYHQVDAKGTTCIDQSLSREHRTDSEISPNGGMKKPR